MDDATNELSSYGDLVVLAAFVERRAADLQILARDFISDRNETAAATFDARITEAESLLDRIAHQPGASGMGELLDGLRANIEEAATRFAEVQATSRIMGLDEHSGLRGKLRASVEAMESELRKWPGGTVAETYVRMQTMRLIEKDFILYGNADVMGGHRKAYREFEFSLMGSGLDVATQETMARLAADYRADLTAFVESQVMLGEQIRIFNGVLSAMPDRFATLFKAASAGMEYARSEKAEVRHRTRWHHDGSHRSDAGAAGEPHPGPQHHKTLAGYRAGDAEAGDRRPHSSGTGGEPSRRDRRHGAGDRSLPAQRRRGGEPEGEGGDQGAPP